MLALDRNIIPLEAAYYTLTDVRDLDLVWMENA